MFSGTPNNLATMALVLWPFVAWLLFMRLGAARGFVAGLILAYLALPPPPAGLDLPLLPPLNKETIPSLVALVLCYALCRPTPTLVPTHPALRVLLLLFFLGPIATIVTNFEPVSWGRVHLPGLQLREVVGIVVQQVIFIAPFLLARALLAQEEHHRLLLRGLVVGGLVYSLPMLIEVRLSPQINTWVYGYFQHSFDQMMRGEGFRPIVFLYHGLWVAFFAMTAVLATCALIREPEQEAGGRTGQGRSTAGIGVRGAGAGNRAVQLGLAAAWLLAVLILCKSLASLLYALVLAPLILLASTRTQLRVAALLAILALVYPMARGAQLVPNAQILALASRIDVERAYSLQFRFDNEAALLNRAAEKPAFGWGLWGRNQIYDPASGRMTSVTDGRWIIVLGTFGWTGFLAEFGILALPLLTAWWRTRGRPDPGDPGPSRAVAAVGLILAVNLVDLIPNATITPLTMLFAGALMGWAERQRRTVAVPAPMFRTVL